MRTVPPDKKPKPWVIPAEWAWTTTGEITTVVGGGTPRTSDSANFDGGAIPWVTPADLSGYQPKTITGGLRNITETGLRNSGAKMVPAGTVLFSSRAPIGYVAIAANPVSTNQGFKSFVPGSAITSDFLYYYMQFARPLAEALASGTTFPEISGANAARIPVPLAPLREQDRIVAEIEKQFTRLDAATAALKRVQANLKRYRASVLKAACEGRLVPTEAELARKEGRDYEPADQLLNRILRERRARWGRRYKEATAPKNPPQAPLPDGWCWVTLSQILREPLRNGHSAPAARGGEIRTLTLSAVTEGDFSERNTKMTAAPSQRVLGLWLEPGDLLVERSNTPELVGTARAFWGERNYAIFPDLLIRVRLAPEVSIPYVEACLQSQAMRRYFQNSAQGISGTMPKIDQSVIEDALIPLPPAAEQIRICKALETIESRMARVDSSTTLSGCHATRLRESVLHAAFSGQLVPQDPNDEPASALLERIRSERADTPAGKRVRRKQETMRVD